MSVRNNENKSKEYDEKLFKQPPPKEDCPICFVRLPYVHNYNSCCGKVVCSGCSYAPVYDNQGNKVDNAKQNKCPFCRTPRPISKEGSAERMKKRMELDDAVAIQNIGIYCYYGMDGFTQDRNKALELWHRAGELGSSIAYCKIGYAYQYGRGVEVDKEKAAYYYKLAAIGGDANARYLLGIMEKDVGNMVRAIKHFMIAVWGGSSDSLKMIQDLYSKGHATKEVYKYALQVYRAYLGEIKSSQRDEAAAFSEDFRYY